MTGDAILRHINAEARAEILGATKRLMALGLALGVGGNVSIRTASGDGALITASGAGLYELSEHLIWVGLDGNPEAGAPKPSKDALTHLAVYRACPDVGAIVHTHSPYATALSVDAIEIPLLTLVSKKLKFLPVLGDGSQGSEQIGDAVGAHIRVTGAPGAVLRAHGAIATGETLKKALKTAELIELTAQLAVLNADIPPE